MGISRRKRRPQNLGKEMRPRFANSSASKVVMRNPLRTKKMSTPSQPNSSAGNPT